MGTQVPAGDADQSLTQMVAEELPDMTMTDLGLTDASEDATKKDDVPGVPARDKFILQNSLKILGNTGPLPNANAAEDGTSEPAKKKQRTTPPASPPQHPPPADGNAVTAAGRGTKRKTGDVEVPKPAVTAKKLTQRQKLETLLEEDAPATPQKASHHEDSAVAGGFASDASDAGDYIFRLC